MSNFVVFENHIAKSVAQWPWKTKAEVATVLLSKTRVGVAKVKVCITVVESEGGGCQSVQLSSKWELLVHMHCRQQLLGAELVALYCECSAGSGFRDVCPQM